MLKLFFADIKMLLRNKQALFWSFMFPLMFTFIFGFFFGKNTSVGTVALINQSDSELASGIDKALSDSGLFKVSSATDPAQVKEDIKKTKVSAGIIIPANFGVSGDSADSITIIEDEGNGQVNSVLVGFLNNYLTQVNFQVQNVKPIYSVAEEKINSHKLTYFDFVLAGILGLALMNSSIIGIAVGMAKYREDQILKRITTAPIKTWWFIVSEVISRLMLNFFQIAIILTVGKFLFDAHIYGNIFVIFAMAMMGGILFQLIGFAIASFSKTTDAAQGMATAITIPMMFLTGVFFPIDSLPKWLLSIVQYLPLAPLLRILRGVVLEANSPFTNPINITIVLAWIAAMFLISFRKFKLTEE
ncbi:MAG: ABC transporter permease [Patescibacteria group bacterium]|nr:ABC transporter permease [Patescibacteria group bacterium]